MSDIEKFKIKRLVKELSSYKGNGTSMISIVVPTGYQISLISKMLTNELGTASNIKSRVNRQSVMSAITSAQSKLKRYSKTPPNGLVVYCGDTIKDGKPKKLNIDFEPTKPLLQKVYMCDDHFHTEYLDPLLEDSDKFGFVIIDGNGINIYTVKGTDTERVAKYDVDLTSKTRRGGQSALRFSRLRDEEKANFLRKATELCKKYFLGNSNLPLVKGIIVAGKAHFKNKLVNSPLLDPRLKKVILKVIEVGYGGKNGFEQALDASKEVLADVKLIEEKNIMSKFMNEIALETGKYCYGVKNVCECLEETVISDLIVYEDLDLFRVTAYNKETDTEDVMFMNTEEMEKTTMDIRDSVEYVDYISEHYGDYGCNLHIVTDRSAIANQIISGFGGLCGILRWNRDTTTYTEPDDDDDDDNFDFGDYEVFEGDFI